MASHMSPCVWWIPAARGSTIFLRVSSPVRVASSSTDPDRTPRPQMNAGPPHVHHEVGMCTRGGHDAPSAFSVGRCRTDSDLSGLIAPVRTGAANWRSRLDDLCRPGLPGPHCDGP